MNDVYLEIVKVNRKVVIYFIFVVNVKILLRGKEIVCLGNVVILRIMFGYKYICLEK